LIVNTISGSLFKNKTSRFFSMYVLSSVAEPHQFYAAPAPGENFDAALAPDENFDAAPPPGENFDVAPALAPTLLYSKAKYLKRTKV
jgi:hypothetical protein